MKPQEADTESTPQHAASGQEKKENPGPSKEKEEVPTAKRAQKPMGSEIKRGFNIRDAVLPKTEDAAEESRRKLRSEEFTAEAAQTAWSQFLDRLEKENRKVEYNAFATGKMEIHPSGHLLFKFGSLTLVNEFNELKEEILLFLRDRLQNDHLMLETELDAAERKKYIKSQREVFDEMSHKNPLLKKLKEDLGLNIDK